MTPRRYQLRKDAVTIVEGGHPWIFREQLSSAAAIFRDGDWLRLVDGQNKVVGHGVFEAEGAIAIRILRRGPDRPDAAWVNTQLQAALVRREPLVARTTGIRLLHGESDGIAAVVVDRFADALVTTSYSAGTDGLARFVARSLARAESSSIIGAAHDVLLRPAHRRQTEEAARVLRGTAKVVHFVEDDLPFAVDLEAGQKTGTYLDLRGLRRAIATAPLAGARVLNLFAYSGMLGRAAERAGATKLVQVDASERALAFAAAHHVDDASKHELITADVFDWLPALGADAQFDLVIVDPPSMTSSMAQLPKVLAAYRKLYRHAATHVAAGGVLVAACCTSRIERKLFHRTVREGLGGGFTMERELPVELDHPVGFPQADYLKIAWWRRT
jgi:23S rRNA (cytosine1962-C5)-methyltransferase